MRDLDNNALFTSKNGFSVVAPIKVIVPFSTKGNKKSCWLLLKRCISSINRIVFFPYIPYWFFASFMTSSISFFPAMVAFNSLKFELVVFAIPFANVVFPVPGGP